MDKITEDYKKNLKEKEVNNIFFSYLDIGKGKPIVFIPSWPLSSIEFIPLINLLKSDYRCICINIPSWLGESRSSMTLDSNSLSDAINQFIIELNLNSFVLSGYSLGGLLALNIAKISKLNIESIFLFSSISNINNLTKYRRNLFKLYSICKKFIPSPILSKATAHILKSTTYKTDYYKTNKELFDALYYEIGKTNMKRAIESLLSFSTIVLDRLDIPVNILNAANDPKFIHESLETFRKVLLINGWHIIENEDHNHIFFSPQYANKFIRRQLGNGNHKASINLDISI